MGNIVLLDELTINQIAAGEVVERPASVIKEMVENSIDAGAKNIVIEIKNGGISFIRITDDGKGIRQDDLEIAFERHATSKIRTADDLDKVTSMGFRGEALASIAAISSIELNSKTEEQENGYRIEIEGGEVYEKEVSACRKGTTITVKNLFFNTPVRYKFLKKDYTESGYIEDVVTRIALVNPSISFKLINTGKTIIQTNGSGEMKDVIYAIFGKETANAIIPVSMNYENIQIDGVIGKPEIARSNRTKQLYFVNKRYIKDKSIAAAIEQGYKGMIPIGKFGFAVLNITMDPSKVDVNVHPAKTEVRFEEEGKIFQSIYHVIKDNLLGTELVEKTAFGTKKEEDIPLETTRVLENPRSISFEERLRILRESKKEVKKEESKMGGLFGGRKNDKIEEYIEEESSFKTNILKTSNETGEKTETHSMNLLEQIKDLNEQVEKDREEEREIVDQRAKELEYEKMYKEQLIANEVLKEEPQEYSTQESLEQSKEEITQPEVKEDFETMYEKMFGAKIEDKLEEKKKNELAVLGENETMFGESLGQQYKVVGIVFNTYIILEIKEKMYILDQHAAHERILYEQVKQNYFNMKTETQYLLMADVITLTHKEMCIVKENWNMFIKAGFDISEFGENTIKISGVPVICLELDTKELFLETLDQINSVARTSKQEKEERFIATVACKAAVKGKMKLDIQEVEALMQDLLKLPNPFTCPHGRPTAIKMDKYNIERKFARK